MTKRILATFLCVVLLCGTLSGCAKSDDEIPGAYITMYLTDDIYDFDPANAYYNTDAINVLSMMYDTLFRLDENGKVKKSLVDSYKIVENEETDEYYIEFTLKEAYWSVQDHPHTDTFEQTAEKVRWLVLDAVERQLPTDASLCVLLSGGLDSSILAAVAARRLRELGAELRTFSVAHEGDERFPAAGPESDDRHIALMRRALGMRHEKIVLGTAALADALEDSVLARDLPGMADVDASMLLLCGEVKRRAPVALSGECADEIFGGYPWFRDEGVREKYGFPWAQSTAYRAEFLRPEWLELTGAEAYVDARLRAALRATPLCEDQPADERHVKELTCLNERWFMQTLLERQDRMSMYSGLEVRAPLCDHRLAEYLYTVPWEMKEYHGHEKGLLRHAMRGLLPQKVLWRKKSPYPKTRHPAYRAAVSRMLREILDDPASPLLTLIRREPLELLLRCDRSIPWYGQLMTTPQTIAYMVQLNLWMARYGVRLAG